MYGKAIKLLNWKAVLETPEQPKFVPIDNVAAGRIKQFNVCNKIQKCAQLGLWPKIQGSNLLL